MAHSVSIHERVSTIDINIIDSVNPRTDGSIITRVVIPIIIIITIGLVLIVINYSVYHSYYVTTETKDNLKTTSCNLLF